MPSTTCSRRRLGGTISFGETLNVKVSQARVDNSGVNSARTTQPPPPTGSPTTQPVSLGIPSVAVAPSAVDTLTIFLASSFTIVFIGGALFLGGRQGLTQESSAPPGTVELLTPLLLTVFYGGAAVLGSVACTGGAFLLGRMKSYEVAWTALFGVSALGTAALATILLFS